jgi:hypothetical protein
MFGTLKAEKDKLFSIKKAKTEIRSMSELDRVGVLEDMQASKINKIEDRLKDIQYEMKNGRPRPTEEHIDNLISKKVKEVEEHISNPTEESMKAMTKDVDEERKFLEMANKLIDRGELPGELRPDTFIKMKQKYLNGYKAGIDKNQKIIDGLSGAKDGSSIKKVKEAEDAIKVFGDRIKSLENRIVVQTDKVKALGALEKPSGAFYKNQIKQARKDLEMFNHDLFKHKARIKTQQELKVARQS